MGAVVQGLFACGQLRRSLTHAATELSKVPDSTRGHLAALFRHMQSTRLGSVSLEDLHASLPLPFNGREQQDAAEFLTVLLGSGPVNSWNGETKLVEVLTEGTVFCRSCDEVAIRHETLRLLDLTFEEGDSGNADLQNLVNNFFAPERLDGRSSDGHKCDRCHERGGSTKAIAITRAPETLLLSLKRFSTDAGGSASKIRTVVRMPDLLTLPDAGRTSYTLSAFIAHKGETVRKGHYTAVVKDEKGGYTTCSDSWVGSDVVEDPLSTPYMYFYTRSGFGGSGDDAQWRVVAPRAEDTAWAAARDHLQDTRRGSPHQPEMPANTTTAPPSSRATCQGSSKKGNACTAKAQLGSKFCGKHAPASSKAKGPTETGSHKPKQRNRKDSGCDEEEPLFKNCIVCDVPQTLYSYKSSTFHHFWDHVQYHWSKGDNEIPAHMLQMPKTKIRNTKIQPAYGSPHVHIRTS